VDDEIIENKYNAQEIITNGELIEASDTKEVHQYKNKIAKVYLNQPDIQGLQRLGTYLPKNLVPETVVREQKLDALNRFHDNYPVAFQDAYTASLEEQLENSQNLEEIGDIIHLLDNIVDENAVMTDPIVENMNYFDGRLKITDLCDIESMKSFPESFDPRIAEIEYHGEIEDMYEDAINSLQHHTNLQTQELAEIFTETSRHLTQIQTVEEPLLGPMPKAQTFKLANRY